MSQETQQAYFQQIIEDYKNIIFTVCNSYCRDPEDRKDLVQEIIIQIWKSLKRYKEEYALSTWIYRISLNVAISYYRKQSKRKVRVLPMEKSIFELTEEPNLSKEQEEKLKLLHGFIHDLDDLNKALMLLFLDGKNHKEIAEILGISESNVSTKIYRVKQKMKEKFRARHIN